MKRPDDGRSFSLKSELNAIGNQLERTLSPGQVASFRELVSVGEPKIAIENLCENLDDGDHILSAELLMLVRVVGERLGVDSASLDRLRDH